MAAPASPPVTERAFLRAGRQQVALVGAVELDDHLVPADAVGEVDEQLVAVEHLGRVDRHLLPADVELDDRGGLVGGPGDRGCRGHVVRPEPLPAAVNVVADQVRDAVVAVRIDRGTAVADDDHVLGALAGGLERPGVEHVTHETRPTVGHVAADQLGHQAVNVALANARDVLLAQLQNSQGGPGLHFLFGKGERGALVGDGHGAVFLEQGLEGPVQPRRTDDVAPFDVLHLRGLADPQIGELLDGFVLHLGHLLQQLAGADDDQLDAQGVLQPLGVAAVVLVDRRVAPDAAHALLVDGVDLVDVLNTDDLGALELLDDFGRLGLGGHRAPAGAR